MLRASNVDGDRRHRLQFRGPVATAGPGRERIRRFLHRTHRLHRRGLDDERLLRHQESVAAAVGVLESGLHYLRGTCLHQIRGIGPLHSARGRVDGCRCVPARCLGEEFRARLFGERVQRLTSAAVPSTSSRTSTARSRSARTSASPMPYADSTPAKGWIMTRVIPSASAPGMRAGRPLPEAVQGVTGHVIAAPHRNRLDGVRHVVDRDPQEPFRYLDGNRPAAGPLSDLAGEGGKFLGDCVAVERARPGSARRPAEEFGLQLAEEHVAVGHAQWTAPPVAAGPGSAPADSGPTRYRAPSNEQIDPPPAATVWIIIIGARMRTPATTVSKARS